MSSSMTPVPEDQLTARDVILKVIEVKDALLSNWKILVLFTALGGGIGYVMDLFLKNPDEFEASIVFNLGAAGGGSSGAFGDLAGLMNMGSTPDANIFTGENFFYFVTSRPVLERTLMKEVEIGGKKHLLANLFIDSSGVKTIEWKDREDLQNFHFPNNDVANFDRHNRVILNELIEKAKNSTEIAELGRKSSFTTLSASTQNERLSILWVNTLLETIEEMYTDNQTRKTRKTLKLLERRADSLSAILSNTETKLARALYNNSQIIIPEAQIPAKKLERNTTFIQALYTEAVGSAERMRVSLVKEAPLFTVIEDIKTPLDVKMNDQRRLKIGILSGILIALITIYFKTVFSTVPKEAKA
jgi:hypothetical protein